MRTIDKRVKVTRRNFLKSGAAAASVTALAGGGTMTIDPNGAWAMTTQHLKPETMVTLVKMARDLYPHDQLGDAYYAKAVESYDAKAGADADLKQLIEQGVTELNSLSQAKNTRTSGFPRVSRWRLGHFKEPSARDRTMRDVFQGFRALGRTVHGPRPASGLAVLRN
jgi:hypothetical protein